MNIALGNRPLIAAFMAAVITLTSLPIGMVRADMIPTEQIIGSVPDADNVEVGSDERTFLSARKRVEAILAKTDVRAQMIALGVDPLEADARIAAMTERELATVAGQLDQLPAGEGIGVGSVLIILFVVFGIAVMLDALGMMNIFPFVCGPGECSGNQTALYPEPAAGPDVTLEQPADDYLYQEERAPAYRRERRRAQRTDPYARRRQPRYETEQYYEPAPAPSGRNYYEERFGTQRQIR